MSSEFICVAIDGTNSGTAVYANSNVKKFFNSLEIDSQYKYFQDGPGEHADPSRDRGISDAITGSSCAKIADEAWAWLVKALKKLPNAKVILIGHSRGGHIVANLAIRLSSHPRGNNPQPSNRALTINAPLLNGGFPMQQKLPTNSLNLQTVYLNNSPVCSPSSGAYFLGLYDAVKMTNDDLGDTSIVPASVEYLCHVKRSRQLGSRLGWENTADKTARKDPAKYQSIELWGTHGSIGGSTTDGCEGGRSTTLIVTALTLGTVAYQIANVTISSCNYEISAEQDRMAGKAAHMAMLVHARKAKIPITKA